MEVRVFRGDITLADGIEAVVSSTNKKMLPRGAGGYDYVIHSQAGKKLDEECKKIGGCKEHQAIITGAYEMSNYQHIIHVVLPKWEKSKAIDENRAALAKCYENVFQVAEENHIKSLSFCLMGTGHKGVPLSESAKMSVLQAQNHAQNFEQILFSVWEECEVKELKAELARQGVEYQYEEQTAELFIKKNGKKAESLLNSPELFENFLQNLEKGLETLDYADGELKYIPVMISALRSYALGEYKEIPAITIVSMIGALIYTFFPPKLLHNKMGKKAVMKAAWKMAKKDIHRYQEWRRKMGKEIYQE